MPENALTREAQQWFAQHIHSVEQLEIFLAVSEDKHRAWTAPEIFRKVQSNENSILRCLQYFATQGVVIVESEGRYRIADNAGLLQIASEFARAYRERYVAVIELIYKPPTRQIQDFADAFKLRKDK